MKRKMSSMGIVIIIVMMMLSCKPKSAVEYRDIPNMPMQAIYDNSMEYIWQQKKVLESKLLSDMETMGSWEHKGFGSLVLSDERSYKGKYSILLESPTKGSEPVPRTGRAWGASNTFFNVDNEDWTDYNRISFWIYPDLPGFKVVSINTIFYNDGEDKVPGVKNGINFQNLKNQEWNKVYWEIEHLGREKVTGFVIQYRLQGNEPGATEIAKYYLDNVSLEKVEPDHYEGWNVQPKEIAYNHAGYAINFPKTAFISDASVKTFSLIDVSSNTKVLEGEIESQTTPTGVFQVADFTKHNTAGTYILEAGKLRTKPFVIDKFASVYRSSVIKTINHFYTQRCGYAIEGVHDACHLD